MANTMPPALRRPPSPESDVDQFEPDENEMLGEVADELLEDEVGEDEEDDEGMNGE